MTANETKAKILQEIERQRMAYSFKMLLLVFMAELADREGRVPLSVLAERFAEFFSQRVRQNKQVENPKRPGDFANRRTDEWEKVIIRDPARRLGRSLLRTEESCIRWAPEVWDQWTPEFKQEIISTAHSRLEDYFDRNAGGF